MKRLMMSKKTIVITPGITMRKLSKNIEMSMMITNAAMPTAVMVARFALE